MEVLTAEVKCLREENKDLRSEVSDLKRKVLERLTAPVPPRTQYSSVTAESNAAALPRQSSSSSAAAPGGVLPAVDAQVRQINSNGQDSSQAAGLREIPRQAKKPVALMPLNDLTFRKFVINKPGSVKRKLSFHPCESVSPASSLSASRNLEKLKARLTAAAADILWLRHRAGTHASLSVFSCQERGQITADTVGQAGNARWHQGKVVCLIASQFAAAVRCGKPDYLLKRMLYPKPGAVSEAMAYGREYKPDAVASYVQLLTVTNIEVDVRETELHLHPQYNFIGASPNRIVTVAVDEGLLEVKCPLSQKGKTDLEAAKQKNFCCEVVGLEMRLKRKHPYFFQVQGQMAVTGHKWCDFVIWTEDLEDTESKGMTHHIETIDFDKRFFDEEILLGLLHFSKHALFPGTLTRRLRRLGTLTKKYVSYKQWLARFYDVHDGEGLKKSFRKL
ncbi:uncharacterized protein ISCGN_010524 [Ixodes scapularis]